MPKDMGGNNLAAYANVRVLDNKQRNWNLSFMHVNSIEMALLELDGNFLLIEIFKSGLEISSERFSGQKGNRNGTL